MSERLKIMAEADEAKLYLTGYDRAQGERRFKELLDRHPSDGMVHFRQAEAYEAIGETRKALDGYERAQTLFPMREWKDRARSGAERCKTDLRLNRLPREIQSIWRDVFRMRRCPPRSLAMTARAAVERTTDYLIQKIGLPMEEDLDKKIRSLEKSQELPRKVTDDLRTVKELGNPAAHGANITLSEARTSFSLSQRIVAFIMDWKPL